MYRVSYPLLILLTVTLLAGCASMTHREPVRISVAGIQPLANEGLEARFAVKLRVQNPNDSALYFDGVFVDIELQDKSFGTGVSDQRGNVPRFGETVVEVPVTVPLTAVVRQLFGVASNEGTLDRVKYRLRGRLGGSRLFGGIRFDEQGEVELGRSPAR